MDVLSFINLGQVGAGALLALVIILIVRGDLIPRKVHQEVRDDRDKKQATIDVLVETNRLLASASTLGVSALQAIEKEARANVRGVEEEGRE